MEQTARKAVRPIPVPSSLPASNSVSSTLDQYLATAPTFMINPPASSTIFCRPLIHKIHGGNPRAFVVRRSRDGRRRFIFPMKAVNPYMPTRPGHPGLLLSGRHEMLQKKWTFFHRVRTNPSRYLYLGEYRHTLARPLSSDEFTRQERTVSFIVKLFLRDLICFWWHFGIRSRLHG